MHSQQDPIVNNWYINLTGQLFKIRMVSYGLTEIGSLVIEYIDGTKQVISKQEWDCLKLMQHNNKSQNKTIQYSEKLLN